MASKIRCLAFSRQRGRIACRQKILDSQGLKFDNVKSSIKQGGVPHENI
jgi:hypothetical protein